MQILYTQKNYSALFSKKRKVPDFSLPEYQNTVYAMLADLNLPIYVTTNYDHFMESALESKGEGSF